LHIYDKSTHTNSLNISLKLPHEVIRYLLRYDKLCILIII
jgi:hypothetical protein